jgi:hypothetical protein
LRHPHCPHKNMHRKLHAHKGAHPWGFIAHDLVASVLWVPVPNSTPSGPRPNGHIPQHSQRLYLTDISPTHATACCYLPPRPTHPSRRIAYWRHKVSALCAPFFAILSPWRLRSRWPVAVMASSARLLACCSTPKVLFCTFLVLHFFVFCTFACSALPSRGVGVVVAKGGGGGG